MSEDTKPAGSKSPAKRGRPRKAVAKNGSTPEAEVIPMSEGAPPPPMPQGEGGDQMPDAVLVIKSIGQDGTLNVDVQTVGSVQVTEVQTLLELGLGSFRNRIGLGVKPS